MAYTTSRNNGFRDAASGLCNASKTCGHPSIFPTAGGGYICGTCRQTVRWSDRLHRYAAAGDETRILAEEEEVRRGGTPLRVLGQSSQVYEATGGAEVIDGKSVFMASTQVGRVQDANLDSGAENSLWLTSPGAGTLAAGGVTQENLVCGRCGWVSLAGKPFAKRAGLP